MEGLTSPMDMTAHPELMGDSYPGKIWWFFMKCWADVTCPPPCPFRSLISILCLHSSSRVSPNLHTKAIIGSLTPHWQTTSNGHKPHRHNNTKTIRRPMPLRDGRPIPTAHITLKGTTRPPLLSRTGRLGMQRRLGARLQVERGGVIRVRGVEVHLHPWQVPCHRQYLLLQLLCLFNGAA